MGPLTSYSVALPKKSLSLYWASHRGASDWFHCGSSTVALPKKNKHCSFVGRATEEPLIGSSVVLPNKTNHCVSLGGVTEEPVSQSQRWL